MAVFPPHPERRPVVVSGASSGIGTAVAEAFVTSGHPVSLGARRLDRLDDYLQQLQARSAKEKTHARHPKRRS